MGNPIGILGLGSWGTALADLLANKGFDVRCWDIDDEILKGIESDRKNPKYHSQSTLHEGLTIAPSKEEVCGYSQVVLAVPASKLSNALEDTDFSPNTTVISAIKGLEPKTLLTPLQYVYQRHPQLRRRAVLSGPSFSTDVIAGRPAGVVAASSNGVVAREVAELFRSDRLRVYLSSDPLGVELGGIVKNVVALAAGVSDGLGVGDSARAALVTRGLAEMMRLAVAMGAEQQTLFGLSGLGDLVMTATCDTSRNRTVGVRLGKGESLEHIVKTLGSTAEAVKSAPLVLQLAHEHQVEMPITQAVTALIEGRVTAEEMLRDFVSRPTKPEF